MSTFESEGRALSSAIAGLPVAWVDVAGTYDLKQSRAGSANHRLGSIPAWGLDAWRRREMQTVNSVLEWCDQYLSRAPLHENEALSSNTVYRERMDVGTYALALLAHLAGRTALRDQLYGRLRASVAWCLLGAHQGPARRLVKDNPQPIDRPHVLLADGPLYPIPGGGAAVPYIAGVGMRGWVRDVGTSGHSGPFTCLDGRSRQAMIAQVLGLSYSIKFFGPDVATLIQTHNLPPWGLTPQEIALVRAYLADATDPALASEIHSWTLPCLPDLPFTYVRRASATVECIMRHSADSSTGAKMVEICFADGTCAMASADNGQRGGEKDAKLHHQPQEAVEMATFWHCTWTSGQGVSIDVPRPPASDPVVWRVDSDGKGKSEFWPKLTLTIPEIPPTTLPQPQRKTFWQRIREYGGS